MDCTRTIIGKLKKMSAERLTGTNKTDDMYPNAAIRIPKVVIIIGTDASVLNVQGRRRMARHTPVVAIATATRKAIWFRCHRQYVPLA